MGAVALFLVLTGGVAYAANTVFSSDIVDGEVKTADIGNNQVRGADVRNDDLAGGGLTGADIALNTLRSEDIADGGVQGIDVQNDTLTGSKIAEGTLNLAAEGLHVVGSPGEPTFQQCLVSGSNVFNWVGFVSQPAFFRDAAGVVHLQGNLRCPVVAPEETLPAMFFLPTGYRPAAFQNHLVIEGGPTETNVVTISDTTGAVSLADPTGNPVSNHFLTLDGITFRCGPSGQNGCP
jgi:hypothetical protein